MTRWLLATQARLGMTGEARACLAALDDERAHSGEVRNGDALICLAEGDPAAALAAMQEVLDGTAPVVGYVTVVVTHLLAGFAHRQLGDQRAANQAAERALGLAEADRLVLPFAITGSRELLEALPRHETAHAALPLAAAAREASFRHASSERLDEPCQFGIDGLHMAPRRSVDVGAGHLVECRGAVDKHVAAPVALQHRGHATRVDASDDRS